MTGPTASIRLFLESRYCKLSRELPQTVFYCPECKGDRRRRRGCRRCGGFGKLTRDSVQEILQRRLIPAFGARRGKFHGAGREDVDVLMLGRGRPFVFEVVGAREREVDLVSVRHKIHVEEGHRVRIAPFVPVPRRRVAELKESKWDKVYRVEATLDDPGGVVDDGLLAGLAGREVEVSQRTPARVAHRRADRVRARRVTVLAARILAPRRVELEVRCAHGTYVKEWISGEDGRSSPSFAELCGVPTVCSVLDVTDIVTGTAADLSEPLGPALAP